MFNHLMSHYITCEVIMQVIIWVKLTIMDLKNFGIKLAEQRQKKELSAYELSLRIGRNPGYINRIECGKLNVSIKSIFQICDELKISPKELFD